MGIMNNFQRNFFITKMKVKVCAQYWVIRKQDRQRFKGVWHNSNIFQLIFKQKLTIDIIRNSFRERYV